MPVSRKLGYIGLGKQTAKGTPVAPSKFVRFQGDTTFTPALAFTQHWEGGMGLDPGVALKESQRYDMSFTAFARPDLVGYLFAWALGVDTVSGAADPYTHIITPHASTIPWLTAERYVEGLGANALVERVQDCRIQQIEVTGENRQPIRLAVNLRGISGSLQTTAGTPTLETADPFVFFHGIYTVDTLDVSAICTAFRITLVNELEEDFFTNDVVRADLPLNARRVELSFTLAFDNPDHYKKVFYGGGTSVSKKLAEGSLTIDLQYTEGTATRQFKIEVPSVYHTNAPIEISSEPGVLLAECTAVAKKTSADPLIKVTVQNSVATAYV